MLQQVLCLARDRGSSPLWTLQADLGSGLLEHLSANAWQVILLSSLERLCTAGPGLAVQVLIGACTCLGNISAAVSWDTACYRCTCFQETVLAFKRLANGQYIRTPSPITLTVDRNMELAHQ